MARKDIQLLILTIDGKRYGIDVDQIAYMSNVDNNEAAISMEHLLEIASEANGKYSKMLFIKRRMKIPILIYEPDEVATVSVADIRSLPNILMLPAGNKGVWGFWPQAQGIVILIDFYKNQLFEQFASGTIDMRSK